jgi:protein O-mannosyl-transferase
MNSRERNNREPRRERPRQSAAPVSWPSGPKKDSRLPRQQRSDQDILGVWIVCALLAIVVLLVYFQVEEHPFINCDDSPYIYDNPNVQTGLTWKNISWSLTSAHAGNWHPLTWMSHMFDMWAYGMAAGKHHMTNVLLHMISSVVLFLAIRRLTGTFWLSAIVAAMFALHPQRVESVAWAAERKDALSGMFWMLTLLCYANYVMRPTTWRYVAIVIVFALGLSSKSMLVTLPCVLLLLDFWPLGRWQPALLGPPAPDAAPPRCPPRPFWWLLVEKLPLFILSAGVCTILVIGQHKVGAMSMTNKVPMDSRVANAAVSCVTYLVQMVWPISSLHLWPPSINTNLAIFYPHPTVVGGAAETRMFHEAIFAALVLLAITAAVLWNLRRRPYLAVGWFWYLGALVPVVGLVQVGAQSRADRYTYLTTIGISIMVVWGAAEAAKRWQQLRMPLGVATATVLCVWTGLTCFQIGTWKDSKAVFQHAVDVVDDNFFAYNHLALAYQQDIPPNQIKDPRWRKQLDEAGWRYKKAVDITPNYDSSNGNYGVYLHAIGNYPEALKYFKRAAAINPFVAGHHGNLAMIYQQMGDFENSIREWREAIKHDEGSFRFHSSLGAALILSGKQTEAIKEFREAYQFFLKDLPAEGLPPGAQVPEEVTAMMSDLAGALACTTDDTLRNGKEALEVAQLANQLTHGMNPNVLRVLAAAYAETGHMSEALQTANKALTIADQQRNLAEQRRKLAEQQKDTSEERRNLEERQRMNQVAGTLMNMIGAFQAGKTFRVPFTRPNIPKPEAEKPATPSAKEAAAAP